MAEYALGWDLADDGYLDRQHEAFSELYCRAASLLGMVLDD